MHVIQKQKLGWVLADSYIKAYDKLQATVYIAWGAVGYTHLEEMKNEIEQSSEKELDSWEEAIALAKRHEIIGHGTSLKPKWQNPLDKDPENAYTEDR